MQDLPALLADPAAAEAPLRAARLTRTSRRGQIGTETQRGQALRDLLDTRLVRAELARLRAPAALRPTAGRHDGRSGA